MKQLRPDLWQSHRHTSGMLNSHAYLLKTGEKNLLFYNTGNQQDLDQIAEMGGISHQLLTHRDEATPSLSRINNRFGAQLVCSDGEAKAISEFAAPDLILAPKDHTLFSVKVMHTPGHTLGSVCYFYQSPWGDTYLFSGDTLFPWNGKLSTLVLPSAGGSRELLMASLLKLRALQPDVVISSGFVGDCAVVHLQPGQWQQVIDQTLLELSH